MKYVVIAVKVLFDIIGVIIGGLFAFLLLLFGVNAFKPVKKKNRFHT